MIPPFSSHGICDTLFPTVPYAPHTPLPDQVYFIITDQNKFCVKFPFLTEILTSPCYDWHSNSERMMKMTPANKAAAQVVLLIAGAATLCIGAWRGEAATVFSKALTLCLECVGIG